MTPRDHVCDLGPHGDEQCQACLDIHKSKGGGSMTKSKVTKKVGKKTTKRTKA